MLGFRSLLRTHDTPDLLEITVCASSDGLARSGTTRAGCVRTRLSKSAMVRGVPCSVIQMRPVSRRCEPGLSKAAAREPGPANSLSRTRQRGTEDGVARYHKPDDHGWTGTPRLARSLVAELPARDGSHLLNRRPRLIRDHEVEEVINALGDPARRGLAFVASAVRGTNSQERLDDVEDLLDDTVGLANAWVLTADASERFNLLARSDHGVRPGFIRTYAPGVAWEERADAQRHRFLSRSTIQRVPASSLRRVLGQRARDQMANTRLPDYLRDLDRILRRESDDALLAGLLPSCPAAQARTC